MTERTRDRLVRRLRDDLIGPGKVDEILNDRPSDVYLTGILYPQRHEFGPEEDDRLGTEEGGGDGGSDEEESAGLSHAMRPASAGISFAVTCEEGAVPELSVAVRCGTYSAVLDEPGAEEEEGDQGQIEDDEEGGKWEGDAESEDSLPTEGRSKRRLRWRRTAWEAELELSLEKQEGEVDLAEWGIPGMTLFYKRSAWEADWLVTLAMVNSHRIESGERRREIQEKTFFQSELSVRAGSGTGIRSRPSNEMADDPDSASASLLYRNAREFAVGHTCAASWEQSSVDSAKSVSTNWIPDATVPRMSSGGDDVFNRLRDREDDVRPLSAAWLAEGDQDDLAAGLSLVGSCYEDWIEQQEDRIAGLSPGLRSRARGHLAACRSIAEGLRRGIDVISNDRSACLAFQLANRAIQLQRAWLYGGSESFSWRPFQLAFLLLTIPSLVDPEDPDRELMDLLWFPTGGGKTEAYLSIVAFTVFLRRLRYPKEPDRGAGVTVIMRYTLRLLTAQQFQRACALILACEYLRRGNEISSEIASALGSSRFGIGLWVGGEATPNRVADAVDALKDRAANSPAQLEHCPACSGRLRWRHRSGQIEVRCREETCPLGSLNEPLPVWTVDEDVYRHAPSLVIGTADKFAQIVRKSETGVLFGVGSLCPPPELIIQDELHLISGPLGTMAGLYEVAIDALCSADGHPPKLIGSTATIRRAEPQIRSLFNRGTRQFPPPGIDSNNSGFAVADPSRPGRLYLGVTTAGRSAKFTLQAVTASLLQGACDPHVPDEDRDGYWTLVAYFNSLRELGGALVLMQDDVGASMDEYASRRDEETRSAGIVEELTSRRSQIEIRDQLEELNRSYPDPAAIDVLLATNMISVGMDIPRLGLMVVNGQPKAMAEYIQSTSRVGRDKAPGLIVSLYNNAKARDRSHYETFCTWHNTLYREVEASSVTPFASRARDRALHAPLVAMLRHTVLEMQRRPSMSADVEVEARRLASRIEDRAREVDPEEAEGVSGQLSRIIEEWRNRGALKRYWDDRRPGTSLLISAEKAASMKAANRLPASAWPTPNSLRNVDPGTPFVLVPRLKPDGHPDPEAEGSTGEDKDAT